MADGALKSSLETVEVGLDTDLAVEMVPKEKEVLFCAVDDNFIEAHARTGTSFLWYFKSFDETTYELVQSGTDNKLPATKSGYYKVAGEYGFCDFETELSVEVKADSLWAPNILTPNGDGHNETFEVFSNADTYSLKIFNRYGDPIHATLNGNWDGGNASSGIYFWHVVYPGCGNREKAVKGWVHLIR